MTNYKLTYFDFDGGRGEPVRIAFHHGGIEFEDERISFEEFLKTRESTRFNSVPTMEIDGKIVTQTNAMLRYVGKKVGLYPEDEMQAFYCDEPMEAVEEAREPRLRHVRPEEAGEGGGEGAGDVGQPVGVGEAELDRGVAVALVQPLEPQHDLARPRRRGDA